jgi:hypothetical protein
MPKPNSERQKAWRDRQTAERRAQREAGRQELRIYAHPEDHPPIRAYAAKMAAKRAKEKKRAE